MTHQLLQELENRNIPGRFLITDYLNFSEPKAINKIADFKNITLKMFATEAAQEGFHTKGYIFKNKDIYKLIVGSSNMTLGALTRNREWNTKIVSTNRGEYTEQVIDEFQQLWNSEYAFAYKDIIEAYTIKYNIIKNIRKATKEAEVPSIKDFKLQPNSMQLGFISNLQKIRESGEDRALLISATGECVIIMTSQAKTA